METPSPKGGCLHGLGNWYNKLMAPCVVGVAVLFGDDQNAAFASFPVE